MPPPLIPRLSAPAAPQVIVLDVRARRSPACSPRRRSRRLSLASPRTNARGRFAQRPGHKRLDHTRPPFHLCCARTLGTAEFLHRQPREPAAPPGAAPRRRSRPSVRASPSPHASRPRNVPRPAGAPASTPLGRSFNAPSCCAAPGPTLSFSAHLISPLLLLPPRLAAPPAQGKSNFELIRHDVVEARRNAAAPPAPAPASLRRSCCALLPCCAAFCALSTSDRAAPQRSNPPDTSHPRSRSSSRYGLARFPPDPRLPPALPPLSGPKQHAWPRRRLRLALPRLTPGHPQNRLTRSTTSPAPPPRSTTSTTRSKPSRRGAVPGKLTPSLASRLPAPTVPCPFRAPRHAPLQPARRSLLPAQTNVMGTLNMLGLAKRVKARFLLSSTSEVYGDPLQHPQTEGYWGNVNPIGERSCYDEGKRVAETLAFDYHREHSVEASERGRRPSLCFRSSDCLRRTNLAALSLSQPLLLVPSLPGPRGADIQHVRPPDGPGRRPRRVQLRQPGPCTHTLHPHPSPIYPHPPTPLPTSLPLPACPPPPPPQALRGEPLTVFGDGQQTRSFQYVSDLVAGLVAVMESDHTGARVTGAVFAHSLRPCAPPAGRR